MMSDRRRWAPEEGEIRLAGIGCVQADWTWSGGWDQAASVEVRHGRHSIDDWDRTEKPTRLR